MYTGSVQGLLLKSSNSTQSKNSGKLEKAILKAAIQSYITQNNNNFNTKCNCSRPFKCVIITFSPNNPHYT